MIAEEELIEAETALFREGQPADALYFLEDGRVDLYYTTNEPTRSELLQGIPVGEINPGEPFSISALIEPYLLSSTAYISRPSRVIKIDAKALRSLFTKDRRLAYLLTYQAAKATVERLHMTRVQLAAVWA
jgi:CRP-like cAMP-binding protein